MRMHVKIAILQSRLLQYELAQAIGVSEYHLSKYVHGRAELSPAQEAKLRRLLNLPVDSIDVGIAGVVEGR